MRPSNPRRFDMVEELRRAAALVETIKEGEK